MQSKFVNLKMELEDNEGTDRQRFVSLLLLCEYLCCAVCACDFCFWRQNTMGGVSFSNQTNFSPRIRKKKKNKKQKKKTKPVCHVISATFIAHSYSRCTKTQILSLSPTYTQILFLLRCAVVGLGFKMCPAIQSQTQLGHGFRHLFIPFPERWFVLKRYDFSF